MLECLLDRLPMEAMLEIMELVAQDRCQWIRRALGEQNDQILLDMWKSCAIRVYGIRFINDVVRYWVGRGETFSRLDELSSDEHARVCGVLARHGVIKLKWAKHAYDASVPTRPAAHGGCL